jgi:rRNA maturation protein Nop10
MKVPLFLTTIFSGSLFLSACSSDSPNDGNDSNNIYVEGVCIKEMVFNERDNIIYKKCVASSISYTTEEDCKEEGGVHAKKCPEKADISCPYNSPQISFIEYFYWITDEAKANPPVSSCDE